MSRDPSQVVSDAVLRLIEETSAATVCARADLKPSAVSTWVVNGDAKFNAATFDKLMRLDEVRAALVARLRDLPSEDQSAWEQIAAKLARYMSPVVGWRLASIIAALSDMDLLDGQLFALEGLVKARNASATERQRAGKWASRKTKAADPK